MSESWPIVFAKYSGASLGEPWICSLSCSCNLADEMRWWTSKFFNGDECKNIIVTLLHRYLSWFDTNIIGVRITLYTFVHVVAIDFYLKYMLHTLPCVPAPYRCFRQPCPFHKCHLKVVDSHVNGRDWEDWSDACEVAIIFGHRLITTDFISVVLIFDCLRSFTAVLRSINSLTLSASFKEVA